MKLLFLRFVLLFALLSFTGCNLIDENFKDEPDFTVLTGVLSAQDPGDEYEGSHLLTDSEGTVFPVRSNMINLGAAQYLDNGVELTGVLNSEDDVFGVTGIKVVEILSDIRVTMAKFQEYKNTELGFRLKYYEDWTIREEEGKVIFFSPEESESQETMEISQSLFPYQPALDEDGGSDTPLEAYFKSQGWFDTLAYTEHQIGLTR